MPKLLITWHNWLFENSLGPNTATQQPLTQRSSGPKSKKAQLSPKGYRLILDLTNATVRLPDVWVAPHLGYRNAWTPLEGTMRHQVNHDPHVSPWHGFALHLPHTSSIAIAVIDDHNLRWRPPWPPPRRNRLVLTGVDQDFEWKIGQSLIYLLSSTWNTNTKKTRKNKRTNRKFFRIKIKNGITKIKKKVFSRTSPIHPRDQTDLWPYGEGF